jgi:DNA-binding LytR/AlgR family response regulator
MNPSALIADDEEGPRAQLRSALASAWPGLRIVAECPNGVEAWDAWLAHEPQVCFLDIHMPGLSGIDVARRIAGRTPVVFVTAFGDHALAAFDAGAVDYVMKPVDPERLAQALVRVRQRMASPAPAPVADDGLQALLARLAGEMRQQRPPRRLDVIQAGVGKEVRLIPVDAVVYFEADARYTRVVYRNEQDPGGAGGSSDALIRTPLKELLAQLDEALFWQVHRSLIVNRLAIDRAVRVDEGTMHLLLRGRSEKLPVSRPFQGLFKGQ